MEGKHISCNFDSLFYETLGDDFMQENSIVLVEVIGDEFENFVNIEDESEANRLFDTFIFKIIGKYVGYDDLDSFAQVVGSGIDEEETKALRRIYFDCDDFKDVTAAVLLYYDRTFVTIVTA